tara:strand:+ start:33 stop:302 length:270 start_codon:yes stop_codon:yes gene_type:complete
MADKETFRICDIVFEVNDEGAACGIQFSEEFMNQDEALRSAMIVAMQTTVNNFVERSSMTMEDEDVDAATQDAINFLDRCVKIQGGRFP